MENRYDNKLREWNQLIIDLTPGNYVLRIILALEVKKIISGKDKIKVLEIGCGEGDLTKYILKYNDNINLDVLDISPEMIEIAKSNLNGQNINNFICEDALKFLEKCDREYDLIVSSWTIHNFKWDDKSSLFEAIYKKLSEKGGLIFMDKVYPDDLEKSKNQLKIQCERYDKYLPEEIAKEINSHEDQDFSEVYRMDESQIIKELVKIGFQNIKIADRVERDIVLIASK